MIYKKKILFLILYILNKITTYFSAATFFVFIEVIYINDLMQIGDINGSKIYVRNWDYYFNANDNAIKSVLQLIMNMHYSLSTFLSE